MAGLSDSLLTFCCLAGKLHEQYNLHLEQYLKPKSAEKPIGFSFRRSIRISVRFSAHALFPSQQLKALNKDFTTMKL